MPMWRWQLSYEATDGGSWSFVGSNVPSEDKMINYVKWIIYHFVHSGYYVWKMKWRWTHVGVELWKIFSVVLSTIPKQICWFIIIIFITFFLSYSCFMDLERPLGKVSNQSNNFVKCTWKRNIQDQWFCYTYSQTLTTLFNLIRFYMDLKVRTHKDNRIPRFTLELCKRTFLCIFLSRNEGPSRFWVGL